MTAADVISIPPAARPEPSAAKPAAPESQSKTREHEAKSFADVLDGETTERTEAAEKTTELAGPDQAPTDAAILAATLQPVPPAVAPTIVPAAASPAAILAGLSSEAPGVPGAVDDAKPSIVPEIAIDTPAPSASSNQPNTREDLNAPNGPDALKLQTLQASGAQIPPSAPPEPQIVAQQAASVIQPAAAPTAKPAAKKDAWVEASQAPAAAPDAGPSDFAPQAAATTPVSTEAPEAPVTLAAALPMPPKTPQQAPQQTPQPETGPGAARAAAAVEAAPATAPKTASPDAQTAVAGADANSPASANKTFQSALAAADAAADLKADAAASNVTSTTATEALTASRASGVETSKAAQASPAAQAAPAATVQVYSRMIERFDGRAQRFEIRLDPVELGRVDVRIEVGADKKVHAVLAAHDSAALSDLMRGQRALETSLRQAGIDVADGGIRFELSSDTGRNPSNGARQGDTSGDARDPGNVWRNFSTMDVAVDASTTAAARPWRSSRLDLVA